MSHSFDKSSSTTTIKQTSPRVLVLFITLYHHSFGRHSDRLVNSSIVVGTIRTKESLISCESHYYPNMMFKTTTTTRRRQRQRLPWHSASFIISKLFVAMMGLWGIMTKTTTMVQAKKVTKESTESLLRTYGNMCLQDTAKTTTTATRLASSSLPSSRRTPLTHKHAARLQWLVEVVGKGSLLLLPTSAQHLAACWMLYDDPRKITQPNLQFRQRYALSVFWYATTHNNSTDQQWDVSDRWMTKAHECTWYGITCGAAYHHNIARGGKVITALEISFNHVGGLLPPELAILQDLRIIDLHGNDLKGVLPHKVLQQWKHLQVLQLHMNGFFGALPTELGYLTQLQELILFGNYFAGTIPTELAQLRHLQVVDLYANFLQGTIPSILGQLPHLREMDLHDNDFVGRMPTSLTNLVQKGKLQSLVCDCLNDNRPVATTTMATARSGGGGNNGRKLSSSQQQLATAPEVQCDGCTMCCQGLPRPKCVDMKTRQEVRRLEMYK